MKGKVTAAGLGGGGPEGPADPGAPSARAAKPKEDPGMAVVECVSAVEGPDGPEGISGAPPQLEEGRGVVPEDGSPSADLARRLSIPRRKAKAVLDEGVDDTEPALDLTSVLSPVGGGGPPGGDGTSSVSELASRARGLGVGNPAKRPRLKIEARGFAAGRLCPGITRRKTEKKKGGYKRNARMQEPGRRPLERKLRSTHRMTCAGAPKGKDRRSKKQGPITRVPCHASKRSECRRS